MKANVSACVAVVVVLLNSLAIAAPVNATYTSEGLVVGSSILAPQQDNWIVYSATGDVTAETVTHPLLGSTTVLRQSSGIQMSRISDANFSFNPHSASDTSAEIVFDAHLVNADELVFGLGDDLGVNTNGRLGPVFGFSGGNYFIREAVFGSFQSAARPVSDNLGDWYRIKLVVDFTANFSNGLGDMYVQNLTDGETDFRPTPIFSGFNLGIGSMDPASQDPSTWNTLYARMGSNNEIDNMNPNFTLVVAPVVPEPSTCLLLGAGALLLQSRAKRSVRARRVAAHAPN